MRSYLAAALVACGAADLEISSIVPTDTSYADHGTSSREDLGVFRADDKCNDDWMIVGDLASGYSNTKSVVVVRETGTSSPPALVKPTAITVNWTNKKGTGTHGSQDGGLFTPVCPDGYGSLGSVGLYHEILTSVITPSDFPTLRCVHTSFLKKFSGSLRQLWNDHGSGCDLSGSAWSQPGVTLNKQSVELPFIAGASNSYDAPVEKYTLDLSKVTIAPKPVAVCTKPEQVRLAFGSTPSEMSVQWATYETDKNATSGSTVQWGSSADNLDQTAQGSSFIFTMDSGRTWFNHVAKMSGLKPVTKYFYRVGGVSPTGGATAWTTVFHFISQVTPDTLQANLPQKHIIMGDMGSACAFSLCDACTCDVTCDASTCATPGFNKSIGMISEVEKNSMFLHLGDFAYNMDSGGGTVGDQFFRNIEQIAAYVPYMVSVGNHENGASALAHYTESFRLMPSNTGTISTGNGVAPNNWYDDSFVHM
jgi:hypothetical protein